MNLITAGRARALARNFQFGKTGKEGEDGKEQVVVLFEIVEAEHVDLGRFISWFGFFTDATFERTIEALRYMGWKGEDVSELPALGDSGELSCEVEIVIEHEEYNGEWQAKVRWVNRPGGSGVKLKKPLEGAELAAFGQRMRGRVRAAGANPGSRSAAPRQPSLPSAPRPPAPVPRNDQHPNAPGSGYGAAQGVDDDIPF